MIWFLFKSLNSGKNLNIKSDSANATRNPLKSNFLRLFFDNLLKGSGSPQTPQAFAFGERALSQILHGVSKFVIKFSLFDLNGHSDLAIHQAYTYFSQAAEQSI
jgi:hypothetical protein